MANIAVERASAYVGDMLKKMNGSAEKIVINHAASRKHYPPDDGREALVPVAFLDDVNEILSQIQQAESSQKAIGEAHKALNESDSRG